MKYEKSEHTCQIAKADQYVSEEMTKGQYSANTVCFSHVNEVDIELNVKSTAIQDDFSVDLNKFDLKYRNTNTYMHIYVYLKQYGVRIELPDKVWQSQ